MQYLLLSAGVLILSVIKADKVAFLYIQMRELVRSTPWQNILTSWGL